MQTAIVIAAQILPIEISVMQVRLLFAHKEDLECRIVGNKQEASWGQMYLVNSALEVLAHGASTVGLLRVAQLT